MCGIYGTISAGAGQKVLAGLKRLEYRGYDSWGIAALQDGKQDSSSQIKLIKKVGQIGQVKVGDLRFSKSKAAIGHTRWATHGGVTQKNAHPHLSSDSTFAVVQNGVVENYLELKESLSTQGLKFQTQTDTEVIVRLIEMNYRSSLEAAFVKSMRSIQGRNSVAVLTRDGRILAMRQGSPLIVGVNQDREVYLSSDINSLSDQVSKYYLVGEGELVQCSANKVQVVSKSGSQKKIKFTKMDHQATQIDKGGYSHFMLKEIYEQAQVLAQVLNQPQKRFSELLGQLRKASRVYILGAGSASYTAGQIGFYLRAQGIDTLELKAYEARSYTQQFAANDLAIVISQSGETADTLEVVEWMIRKKMKIASLVNMSGSTLQSQAQLHFPLGVGPEIGVASTKAVTGQMMWGQVLSSLLEGQKLGDVEKDLQKYLRSLDTWLQSKTLKQVMAKLVTKFFDEDDLYVLGRGQLYYPALEFALKLKEISYIHAEGFSGGELKHGVIALIDKGVPVICLVAEDEEKADILSAAIQVKARGATVIGVAEKNNQVFDYWIPIPESKKFVAISSVIPAQLLTYYLALRKGFDPDKPRNLAKSVTVK